MQFILLNSDDMKCVLLLHIKIVNFFKIYILLFNVSPPSGNTNIRSRKERTLKWFSPTFKGTILQSIFSLKSGHIGGIDL